jgi:hypothetical protein
MQRRLERLKDRYAGRSLLVVSCGPSARYWRRVRRTLPKDAVLACIKQAIFICHEEARIHFFNPYNCQRYHPYNKKALKIFVAEQQGPPCFNTSDLVFSLDPRTCGSLANTVASTGKFDEYTIDKAGLLKPWGPGIMYEIVVYLAIYLGFGDIHTIGWDVVAEPERADARIADTAHFYDITQKSNEKEYSEGRWALRSMAQLLRTGTQCFDGPVMNTLRLYRRHFQGHIYNKLPKSGIMEENEIVAKSLSGFVDWLSSEQVKLTIHTDVGGRCISKLTRPYVLDVSEAPTKVLGK